MKARKIKFKPYNQNQLMVLPPIFEDLISPTHPVRIVNQVIDQIDLKPLLCKFKGRGTSSYHPRCAAPFKTIAIQNREPKRRRNVLSRYNFEIRNLWAAPVSPTREKWLKN